MRVTPARVTLEVVGEPPTTPFLSSTVFHFFSFFRWVGVVGMMSSDWKGDKYSLMPWINNNNNNKKSWIFNILYNDSEQKRKVILILVRSCILLESIYEVGQYWLLNLFDFVTIIYICTTLDFFTMNDALKLQRSHIFVLTFRPIVHFFVVECWI